MAANAQCIDMIRRLVSFDTTSRNSNLALMDFVSEYLASHGIEAELVYDDERNKANLYATLGPQDRPGIALSGHTDVVPVDGQEWDTDPFEMCEVGDKLYGRGTADMKSFIAVCLALVPEFLSREITTPLHLALSHDEEIGCVGVRSLIDALRSRPVKPYAVIVGEPTEMKVVRAHKGKLSYRCHVRGHEAHSSLSHLGVNAVEAAAEAIAYLKGLARRFRDEGPFDDALAPPYTTVHTGTVRGGTALNIVPKDCSFEFEFRHLPDDDPHDLLENFRAYVSARIEPEMRAVSPDTGFRLEPLSHIPGLNTDEESDVVQLAKALTGQNSTAKVAFGTEAGLFQDNDMPAVVCGPGSIEQAHKPNEYISLEQVERCETFVRKLFERCW